MFIINVSITNLKLAYTYTNTHKYLCCCSLTKLCTTLCDPMDYTQQASLSFSISRSWFKLMSIEPVLPSNHLLFGRPLLLLSSIFPSIRAFSRELVLHIGGQRIGASASASVPPMNIQDWYPLELTGLISLLSEGSSGVFSSTAGWKHWFRELEQCSWSRSIPVRETRRQPGFLLSRWVDFYQATFPQTGLVLQTGV